MGEALMTGAAVLTVALVGAVAVLVDGMGQAWAAWGSADEAAPAELAWLATTTAGVLAPALGLLCLIVGRWLGRRTRRADVAFERLEIATMRSDRTPPSSPRQRRLA